MIIPYIDRCPDMPATEESAGYDLRSMHDAEVHPDRITTIRTGIRINMSDTGLVGLISSRSGLYNKHGIRVGQGHGTLDADFQGEILVLLTKDTPGIFRVGEGDRIAQLVFLPFARPSFAATETFARTERGEGGLGHTGIK